MQYFIDEIIYNYKLESEYETCMNYHREAFLDFNVQVGNSTAGEYSFDCILKLLLVNEGIRDYNQYVATTGGEQEAYFENIFYGNSCEYLEDDIQSDCLQFLSGSFENVSSFLRTLCLFFFHCRVSATFKWFCLKLWTSSITCLTKKSMDRPLRQK